MSDKIDQDSGSGLGQKDAGKVPKPKPKKKYSTGLTGPWSDAVDTIQKLGLRWEKAETGDRAYICSTWIQSAIQSRFCPPSIMLKSEPEYAELCIHRDGVWVICSGDGDSRSLHGWVCGDRGIIRNCYVAPEFRGSGVMEYIISRICGNNPEYTRSIKWQRNLQNQLKFNPYRILELPLKRLQPKRMTAKTTGSQSEVSSLKETSSSEGLWDVPLVRR